MNTSIHTNMKNTVELAKQGDKTAFTSLVSEVSSTVHAIALAMSKDLQDAKDISQLVFIKMWQQ